MSSVCIEYNEPQMCFIAAFLTAIPASKSLDSDIIVILYLDVGIKHIDFDLQVCISS